MSVPKRRESFAIVRPVRLTLVLCALLASCSSVGWAKTLTKNPPFIDLQKAQITETFFDGPTFVAGIVKKVEYTGKQSQKNATVRTDFEIEIQIEVLRHYCGAEVDGDPMSIKSVWYRPSKFLIDGVPSKPEPGQRIFYLASKKGYLTQAGAWMDGRIAPASDAELDRYDRIFQIMACEDGDLAVAQLRAGCFAADAQYASWCLNALVESHRVADHVRPEFHKRIRQAMKWEEVLDLSWRVVQNVRTPYDAYENADRKLTTLRLGDAEMQIRHHCHMRRLAEIAAVGDSDPLEKEIDDELRYLIRVAYPQMPAPMRIEAIQELTRIARPGGSAVFRSSALYSAPYLWVSPYEAELRSAILAFYQKLAPIDLYCRYAYFRGLRSVMQTDSVHSKKLCREGLSLFELAVITPNERNAQTAASELTYYCKHCRERKIEWEALLKFTEEMRDATSSAAARAHLSKSLKSWGVEEKRLDES
ncbi:hypothetical protein LOC68_13345 [Blastopirellula sp. JC732]|uniref:Uncharacterized protein n=1 Tax=Blastopirellula sediminis TaxID=2894196 RepID=A0A9X1SH38_9BACT|nr:hypothetical protein [Blastopirellula sediminis]MCC9607326.1 hypothetical protein [Blastopirellula sediminis]MCC9629381.1 hypothetical protein [Blastopirellula sediminis]